MGHATAGQRHAAAHEAMGQLLTPPALAFGCYCVAVFSLCNCMRSTGHAALGWSGWWHGPAAVAACCGKAQHTDGALLWVEVLKL